MPKEENKRKNKTHKIISREKSKNSKNQKNKINLTPLKNESLPMKNFKNLNINLFPTSSSFGEPGQVIAPKGSIPLKLNRTFFKIRNKNFIERHKENEKLENKIYLEKEYCRKNCRDKLFKNLDLDQRYYLNKEIINLHCENCPIYLRENANNRSSSMPTSYREKRKNNYSQKEETLLNISLAKSTTNGKLMSSNKEKSVSGSGINNNNRILDDSDLLRSVDESFGRK